MARKESSYCVYRDLNWMDAYYLRPHTTRRCVTFEMVIKFFALLLYALSLRRFSSSFWPQKCDFLLGAALVSARRRRINKAARDLVRLDALTRRQVSKPKWFGTLRMCGGWRTELGVVLLLKDEITAISGKQNTSVKWATRGRKKVPNTAKGYAPVTWVSSLKTRRRRQKREALEVCKKLT